MSIELNRGSPHEGPGFGHSNPSPYPNAQSQWAKFARHRDPRQVLLGFSSGILLSLLLWMLVYLVYELIR